MISLLTVAENHELGLQNEQVLYEQHGIQFLAFPIINRSIPDSVWEAKQIVGKVVDLLRMGHNVGFHCRQSVGLRD